MSARAPALFRHLSIKNKVRILVCLFTLIVGCLFLLGEMRSDILSGVRAYVGGEGLWSKAQKNAVRSLLAYSRSHAEGDYQQFLQSIAVPLGDRQARLELQKPEFDERVVTRGFVQGRNHPEDVPSMTRLFRWFHGVSYMSRAIEVWSEGDDGIDKLIDQGTALHREMNSRQPSQENIEKLVRAVNITDSQLTPLEDEFSYVLSEGARWIHMVLTAATFVCTLLLVVVGAWCSGLLLEHIRQSDEKYHHIFSAANDAMFVIDAQDQTVLEVNVKAAALVAPAPAEVPVRPDFPFCPPEERELYRSFFRRALTQGNETTDELHLVASDATIVPVEVSASQAEWDGRQVLFAVFRNIRERREAEERMRASEKRFRSLIQNLSDIILVVTAQGEIVFQSPSVERALGYTRDHLSGKNLIDYVHPDDVRTMQFLLAGSVAHPAVTNAPTFRCRHAEGSWLWLEAVANNLTEIPSVRGIVLTARDISERRILEDEVRQAQKMEAVGRLAGGVAHDFNNLLMIVQGYAERALADYPDPALPLHKHMQSILKATSRATSLTRRLLTFSRKQAFAPKIVDLNAILQEMEGLLRSLLTENIRLQTNLDPTPCRIHADPEQIEQIVMNLVVNARDAMPRGGTLVIETANVDLDRTSRRRLSVPSGRHVMLAVSDTGDGMDAKTKERIFEPFFSTKPKNKGTGLGLSIVFGVVKQSGGQVFVYSEPGQGSLFEIFLPRADGEIQAVEEPPVMEAAQAATETILVVEDEEDLRMIVCDMLGSKGYRILDAENGAAALTVAANHRGPIHLLLTDMMMPGMRGSELAKQMVAARNEIKVLYMSGYADASPTADSDEQIPEEALLKKPFRLEELARRIRQVLQQAPKEGSLRQR